MPWKNANPTVSPELLLATEERKVTRTSRRPRPFLVPSHWLPFLKLFSLLQSSGRRGELSHQDVCPSSPSPGALAGAPHSLSQSKGQMGWGQMATEEVRSRVARVTPLFILYSSIQYCTKFWNCCYVSHSDVSWNRPQCTCECR